jgi:hypothetical protein
MNEKNCGLQLALQVLALLALSREVEPKLQGQ